LRIKSLARDLAKDFVPDLNLVVLPSEDSEALYHARLGEVFEECKELDDVDGNSKRLTMVFHRETYNFIDPELDI
jgi:hypothetical protein